MAQVKQKLPTVLIRMKDGNFLPMILVSDKYLLNLQKGGKGHRGIPTHINASGTEVYPEPDGDYELFTLRYYGTVGHDGGGIWP